MTGYTKQKKHTLFRQSRCRRVGRRSAKAAAATCGCQRPCRGQTDGPATEAGGMERMAGWCRDRPDDGPASVSPFWRRHDSPKNERNNLTDDTSAAAAAAAGAVAVGLAPAGILQQHPTGDGTGQRDSPESGRGCRVWISSAWRGQNPIGATRRTNGRFVGTIVPATDLISRIASDRVVESDRHPDAELGLGLNMPRCSLALDCPCRAKKKRIRGATNAIKQSRLQELTSYNSTISVGAPHSLSIAHARCIEVNPRPGLKP